MGYVDLVKRIEALFGKTVVFTPVPVSGPGTQTQPTFGTCLGRYTRMGPSLVRLYLDIPILNPGTGAFLSVPLPPEIAALALTPLDGVETSYTALPLSAWVSGGAVTVRKGDASSPVLTAARYVITGDFETA